MPEKRKSILFLSVVFFGDVLDVRCLNTSKLLKTLEAKKGTPFGAAYFKHFKI